jgi:alanine-glyoxylate transaminase/serine-glyoxylate transaminase/serine-pyruvate transaminase
VLAGIRTIFKTENPVIIYPASGTGAWEAALCNTLSPGDRILMFETGWFSTLWNKMATKLGLEAEVIPGDWRHGVMRARSRRGSPRTRATPSRPSVSCITRPRPA